METETRDPLKFCNTSDAPFPCYSVNNKVGLTRHLHMELRSELWKLEPLGDERKRKWRTKMDWLLSPTNHMIELVPAGKSGSNGQRLEIITAKPRADIHMNLPALRKLDSMLLVPVARLSGVERTKLVNQEKVVNQIFKAAKAINENVLAEMPVPTVIKDALPKCGRTSLEDDLYRMLSTEPISTDEMLNSLSSKSENNALESVE